MLRSPSLSVSLSRQNRKKTLLCSDRIFIFSPVESARSNAAASTVSPGGYEDLARFRDFIFLRTRPNSIPLCSRSLKAPYLRSGGGALRARRKREERPTKQSVMSSSTNTLPAPPSPADFASFFERRSAVSPVDDDCRSWRLIEERGDVTLREIGREKAFRIRGTCKMTTEESASFSHLFLLPSLPRQQSSTSTPSSPSQGSRPPTASPSPCSKSRRPAPRPQRPCFLGPPRGSMP